MANDSDLARAIAVECYGVEPVIERISRLNNAVFRLRFADGCKILKLAKSGGSASIAKELMLIKLLARHGLPVPAIEYESGNACLAGRPFIIMNSAGERTVADSIGQRGEPARQLFTEMGCVPARIHAITFPQAGDIRHNGIVPRDAQNLLQDVYQLADWSVGQRLLDHSEVAFFKSLEMPSLDGAELCHGDFHAVQCIVHEGRITAVVDWESAWAGNSAIDLAMVHAYLDSYCPPELIRCFFAGYASVRALPDDYERASLPVRMAHTLGLLRVWHGQGRQQNVKRAVDLFRAYARQRPIVNSGER